MSRCNLTRFQCRSGQSGLLGANLRLLVYGQPIPRLMLRMIKFFCHNICVPFLLNNVTDIYCNIYY
jgi:hypothetical protein